MAKAFVFPSKFSVKLPTGQMVDVEPDAALLIDRDNLSENMAKQPGTYAYYGALHAEQTKRVKDLKMRAHERFEELDVKYRKTLKRMSETALKTLIKRDVKWLALTRRANEASRKAALLLVLKEALIQRASMLQSIGANTRTERDRNNDLRTMKQAVQQKFKKHKTTNHEED